LRILIPDARFSGDAEIERAALQPVLNLPGASLELHRFSEASALAAESWRAADAVIVSSARMRLGADTVALLDRCRLVVRSAVGIDNIDLAACARRNIPVCNVPDYGTEEVANHAIGLMLALRRGLMTYTEMLAADPVTGWRWDSAPWSAGSAINASASSVSAGSAAPWPSAQARSASGSSTSIRM
jgi:C-terminal binding protein